MSLRQHVIGRVAPGGKLSFVLRNHESNVSIFVEALDTATSGVVTMSKGIGRTPSATLALFGGGVSGWANRVERVDFPLAGAATTDRLITLEVTQGEMTVSCLSTLQSTTWIGYQP